MFKSGKVYLGEEVLDECIKNKEEVEEKERQAAEKRKQAWEKKKQAAQEVRALGKTPDQWTAKQLSTMVSYKSKKGDLPLPKKKEELIERWVSISHRLTPPNSPVH